MILLMPTGEQEQQLRSFAEASAHLWNMANYERRQALFFSQSLWIPTYAHQCRRFKDTNAFKQLGTCKAQALLSKLREAWGSYHALKRLEQRGKLPSHITRVLPPCYMKNRTTRRLRAESIYVRNDGYRQDEDKLVLAKTIHIRFRSGDLWIGKQGRLELHYDQLRRRWYGHIPVKVKWPRKDRPHQSTRRRASIDLGICNLATCVVEGASAALVYSGRAVLSDWRYWTKRIAAVESELKRMNQRDSSKQLSRLYRTRRRRLDHAMKSMLRDLYEHLEDEHVTNLVVGNLKHIRDGNDHGKVGNQKLHNFWPFAQIRQRINELAEEYGICVSFKSERGTSKCCSICRHKHENGRVKRGLYKCAKTGVRLNADVNGAANILHGMRTKVAADSGSRPMAWPMLLKWNSQRWETAAA